MSSLETNTYTAKPTVQVANAITVTKPIVTGNILTKDPGIQNQQPKRIQPLLKPVIEHQIPNKVKGSAPTIFQLKNLHNPVPASASPDISRIEITRKQSSARDSSNSVKNSAPLELKKSEPVASRSPVQQTQPRRIFSLPKQTDSMGNEHTRMQNPGAANRTATGRPPGNPYGQSGNVVQQSVTTQPSVSGVSVAMMSQPAAPSITSPPMASIIKGNSTATTESHVLTTFDTRSFGTLASGSQSIPASTLPSSSGPRVVSTSSSKTITGASNTATGFLKGHKPAGIGAQHAAVIHSSPNVRGTQNQSIRPGTPPIRTVTAHRPINATNIAPAASTQNPTTVQITIHQPPKNSVNTGPSDRLPQNTHQTNANTLFTTSDMTNTANQLPQVRQKLVISQSPSGVIQQNRTTIPLGPDAGRISSVQTHTVRRSFRPIISSSTGQHDYVRTDPQPIPGTTTKRPDVFSSRPGVAMQSVSDHKINLGGSVAASTSPFSPSPSVTCTVITSGQTNFFQSTVANPTLSHHQNYKTAPQQQHPYPQPGQPVMSSVSNPSTLSSTTLIPTVANQSVINNTDNSSQDSTGSTTLGGSPRPSILRKRTHDSMNTVVVKKVFQPSDRFSVLSTHADRPAINSSIASTSQLAQSSPDSRLLPLTTTGLSEKDNASQSSTDTAMSSESPPLNHKSVKQEVPDICSAPSAVKQEPVPPDVSPRKKPRKQLLNTAAELKDQHDSSTEEETETKFAAISSHSLKPGSTDDTITSPIKEDFVDREGVRWVKMRHRQVDPLLCFYNCTWKSRNNHFQRRSDIKVKEERRPVVSELSNQKGVLQKASGWKFYHISAQFHEMIESEERVNKHLSRLQDVLPPSLRQHNSELAKLYELAQANKQRCSLTKDQLQEAKSSMFSILDQHKSQILEIIHKHHSKRPVKKKERS